MTLVTLKLRHGSGQEIEFMATRNSMVEIEEKDRKRMVKAFIADLDKDNDRLLFENSWYDIVEIIPEIMEIG